MTVALRRRQAGDIACHPTQLAVLSMGGVQQTGMCQREEHTERA